MENGNNRYHCFPCDYSICSDCVGKRLQSRNNNQISGQQIVHENCTIEVSADNEACEQPPNYNEALNHI